MRKTLRASVLTLALCAPAFAGDIPCPSVVAPPTNDVETEQTTDDTGEPEAADSLTATLLNVIESVLALL